jgi:YD repeat-containing protein
VFTYEDSGSCSIPAGNNGNLCSVTDPFNHTTSFTYDGRGNVLTRTDPNLDTWAYTYTPLNDIQTARSSRTDVNDTTTYGYTAGNLTSVLDASGKTTVLHYDDPSNKGLVTSVVDPLTHTTTFTYDVYGNRQTALDAVDKYTYNYDVGGRLTSVIDAMTPARTTTFTYDGMNDLVTVQDAFNGANALTVYGYDAVGNRKTATNPAPDAHRRPAVVQPIPPATATTRPTTWSPSPIRSGASRRTATTSTETSRARPTRQTRRTDTPSRTPMTRSIA